MFADVLRALRDDTAPQDLTGLPEPELTAAREVAALLARRRRRESELAALYETAGDLSSLHDLQEVLDAIVRRARALLRSDTAYLTLNDPDRGDTYMRVTYGIETQAFKAVRLPMGGGLGGLVAETGRPYATADYPADARFQHVIDATVAGERLVAILGVPLRRGDRVIGVLYAADRRSRTFVPEEVALLESLAAHAAVAIENAALFGQAEASLRSLTEANAVIQAHSEAVERAAAVHERLTSLVLSGGGTAEVARAVAEVLGADLHVVDPAGRVVVSAPPGAAPPVDPAAAVRAAQEAGRTVPRRGRRPGWATPLIAGPQQLGALVLLRPELSEADLRTLERAAQVTALLLLGERSLAEAERRVRGELLDDLLAPVHRDPDGLRRRAALLAADLDAPHVVLVVRTPDLEDRRRVGAEAARLVAETGGVSGEHDGAVVLLLRAEDASRAGALVLRRLGPDGLTVGAAGPACGPDALAEAHAEAARCQQVLLALGRAGSSASRDDLGVLGLLFSAAGRDELERFVRRTVGPVLDHDAARGTALVATLAAWFACDGNATRTAAALFVHVNTLYQRLDRVAALLGPGWRHGDAALQVHLALQVHAVTATGTSGGPRRSSGAPGR